MGLDMYLEAELYTSGYFANEWYPQLRTIVEEIGIPLREDGGSISIKAQVGYWRKANAIHAWFVDNVQDCRDECQRSEVAVSQLQDLRDNCQLVLDGSKIVDGQVNNGTTWHADGRVEHHVEPGRVVVNAELAEEHLPSHGGFFFGSTDYDEWYLRSLEQTIEICDKCIAAHAIAKEKGLYLDFYYQSSW